MEHNLSSPSGLSQSGRWKPSQRWSNRPPVIWLAEDDIADQELVRRALGDRACHVRMVSDGVELIESLQQAEEAAEPERARPDLILLDLNMPRKDGRQALREIREMNKGAAIPVVVFSTSDNIRDIKECYEAGCNSYITKPGELDEFNSTLERIAGYWLEVSALP